MAPGENILSTAPETLASGTCPFTENLVPGTWAFLTDGGKSTPSPGDGFSFCALTDDRELRRENEILYQTMRGSSMAAGFISGGAAILRAMLPESGCLELKQLLFSGIDPIDSIDQRMVTGGHLNLFKTLAQFYLPGDINKDYKALLEDSILGLKILSGNPCDDVDQDFLHWDGNNDSRLGASEIIRALQY